LQNKLLFILANANQTPNYQQCGKLFSQQRISSLSLGMTQGLSLSERSEAIPIHEKQYFDYPIAPVPFVKYSLRALR
jgi:hypothetical protein